MKDVLDQLWSFWQCLNKWQFLSSAFLGRRKALLFISSTCSDLMVSQIVSHISTFASLWVIGCWLAAVLFAVSMASVPGASNPLRYSLSAALPRLQSARVSVWSPLLTPVCPTLSETARLSLSPVFSLRFILGSWAWNHAKWRKPAVTKSWVRDSRPRMCLKNCY